MLTPHISQHHVALHRTDTITWYPLSAYEWLRLRRRLDGSETVSADSKKCPSVSSPVRRAGAFAAVGSLALVMPLADITDPAVATVVVIGPFLCVAALALVAPVDSTFFDLFARPGEYREGTLYGLAGFSLAAAGVAMLVVGFGMPAHIFVATVLTVAFGNLAGQLVRWMTNQPVVAVGGFVAGGFLVAAGGQALTVELMGLDVTWQVWSFLAASITLTASLVRETVLRRDDALAMVVVALGGWLLAGLVGDVSTLRIAIALAVTVALGYVSFALGAASIAGMLTGILLGLLTIVLGGYGWFVMLVAFFGIGGLSSKYRYEQKVKRGVAQADEGARGSGNVLANSLVALVAVLAVPVAPELGVSDALVFYAFAGSIAAALADTLSSELGGLSDDPRLITTFEVVDPGTDGAITWQGTLFGLVGAGIIAGIALLDGVALVGVGLIVVAGFVGMTADSFLGATIEGRLVGNQGINFLATLIAAIVAAGVAGTLGVSM